VEERVARRGLEEQVERHLAAGASPAAAAAAAAEGFGRAEARVLGEEGRMSFAFAGAYLSRVFVDVWAVRLDQRSIDENQRAGRLQE
jgi:hypothetical protein